MSAKIDTLEVRVKSVTWEAQGINSYELRPMPGQELPPFTAGSHIDLHLPNGMIRSYSLVNPQSERHRYVIAVNRDASSRGGSRYVHESVRPGDLLTVSAPRNNFELKEDAPHSLLIAGGIGITPIWCMVQRLEELGRPWELYYCTRTRQNAAFLDELRQLGERVHLNLHVNFDEEPGGKMLDIAGVLATAKPETHVYCCGPLPMLAAFEEAAKGRAPETVHVEYFSAKEAPAAGGGFTVVLAKSGKTIAVPPGKTILDAVLDAGIDAPYACMEGVCGTCETKVIEGEPDHRDLVLSQEERAASKTMMICCSGCNSARLVLDL
jgi:tetrachlorobenzoquinone reductase